MKPSRPTVLIAALIGGALLSVPAAARSLDAIKASGTIAVCANPNALPFASRKGPTHGFQLDLAAALARRLGVSLTPAWVISRYDMYRAPCDIVMESIADAEVQARSGIQLSKPYRHSGVMLAVRAGDHTRSLADLKRGHKTVGVLVSSLAAMMLNQHGIETAPDIFEDDLLDMLRKHEVDAAAVTAASVGYYNLRHPKAKLQLVDMFEGDPDLSWNVAVGMRKSDPALIQAVDTAMAQLEADGTVKRIYAKYGITIQPPR
jgi:polar amino acid transport system substrate-binding protein